jgi:hypothetical protein
VNKMAMWNDPALAELLDDIQRGSVQDVERKLTANRNLANKRVDIEGTTVLMKATTADKDVVEKIRLLLRFNANLSTRRTDRRHVLLYACAHGVSPAVFDCLWQLSETKKDPPFRWGHCDSSHCTSLDLAVKSGNVELASHVMDTFSNWNSGQHRFVSDAKLLWQAIESGRQEMVLFLLPKLNSWDDFEELNDQEDDWRDGGSSTTITIKDCVLSAIKANMIDAIEWMSNSQDVRNEVIDEAFQYVWADEKDPSDRMARLSLGTATDNTLQGMSSDDTVRRLKSIIQGRQCDLAWRHNRHLLPILLVRLQGRKALEGGISDPIRNHVFVRLTDDVLRVIQSFIGTFSPVAEAKKMREKAYFQKHAEYCSDCEGWFLPCQCMCTYRGYLSD